MPDRTERELREALSALADGVQAAPDAYRTARGEWLRRERRRRLVLAVLIAVVFALATLIGLWVLNQTPARPRRDLLRHGVPRGRITHRVPDGASLPRPHP